MRNLVVTLADLEGVPHGSATARTSVVVAARYTWDLVTTDGAVIPAAMKPKPLPTGGAVTFSVHPSQDPDVAEGWRGFGVVVEAIIRRTDGRGTDVRVSRTVVVPPGSGSVQLGSLAPAEPLPPDYASVADVIGDFDARLDSLEDHPADHANRHATGGSDPITPASIGAAPAAHADSHATGGSDPITPESIGAAADPTGTGKNAFVFHGTSYEGHANDAPLGAVWVRTPEVTAKNGYPQGGAGLLETVMGMSSAYMRQMFSRAGGEEVWVRVVYGGSWRPWKRLVTDDDPRLLDTGWRVVTSWDESGTVTGSLPNGLTVIADRAGHIRYRREGMDVTLSVTGAAGSSNIPIPSGFSPAPSDYCGIPRADGGTTLVGSGYVYNVVVPSFSNPGYSFELRWRSRLPWPTTLPGTPA